MDHTYGCIGFNLTPPSGQSQGFMICRWPPFSSGWHHMAGVFQKATGEVRIYLDGEAFGDPHYFGTDIQNSTAGLRVGGQLSGAVDELRISDVARYAGSSYTVPTSPFTCDAHIRALWRFDEVAGSTTFHDICGIDNLLVGHNGAHTEGLLGFWLYLPLTLE